MTEKRRKPTPGHRMRMSFRFVAQCECGWQSTTWCGKGGQGSAIEEWRQHIDRMHRDDADKGGH